MKRFARTCFVFVGACGATAPTPTPQPIANESPSPPGQPERGPVLAKRLAGPFGDPLARCADCELVDPADVPREGDAPAAWKQIAVAYAQEADSSTYHCTLLIETSAGWFVGPRSEDICREPSYIDLEKIRVDTDGAVTTVSLDVFWHTKNFDDEARYTLTALCGVAGGRPACTPLFPSSCEVNAPVTGCLEDGFDVDWTIDGTLATFSSDRRIENPLVPRGKHRLFAR